MCILFNDYFINVIQSHILKNLLSIIDLEKTKAIDDRTLFIKLKRPAAYFIYLTAYGLALPIRKDLIEKHGRNWTEPQNLVTNGPFYLADWHHEYKIKLKRNPRFHQKISKSDIRYDKLAKELHYFMVQEQSSAFNLYENNSIDWIDNRSIPRSSFSSADGNIAVCTAERALPCNC